MTSFADSVRKHSHAITTGTLLSIDPASGGTSAPGYAAFRGGEMLESGTLKIGKGSIQSRLRAIYECLQNTNPDVLVIEKIRGNMAHEFLRWSVGVIVAATCPTVLIECPTSTWRSHAGKAHKKSDEADAVAIGKCTLAKARAEA